MRPQPLAPFVFALAFGCAPTPAPSAPAPQAAPAAVAVTQSNAAPVTIATDLAIGQTAPDFAASDQDGKPVHLADLRGHFVVVYFYPKDETPGCTKEACSFRDSWTALGKTGAVLVGVSADSLDSHKAFASHYKLPFLLVSDPDGSIGKKYGVPFAGHHQRQTIVIGADGKVRKVYRKVDVTMHAQEILADVTTS